MSNTQDVEKQLLAVKSLEPSVQIIAQIQPVSAQICLDTGRPSRLGKGVTDILQMLMDNEDWEEDKAHIQSLLWCFYFCIVFDSVKVELPPSPTVALHTPDSQHTVLLPPLHPKGPIGLHLAVAPLAFPYA